MKEQREIFEREGVSVIDMGTTSGAHHYFVASFMGQQKKFFAPCSCSDNRRGHLNFRGDVRKWKRTIIAP